MSTPPPGPAGAPPAAPVPSKPGNKSGLKEQPGWPASELSVRPQSPRAASWVMVILLAGLFLDYGGGFGIKAAVSALALVWVLACRDSLRTWIRFRWDILGMLVLPVIIGWLHVAMDEDTDWQTGIQNLCLSVSPAFFLVFYPLIRQAGTGRVQRMILLGMLAVAGVMLALAALCWIKL